MIIDFHSSHLIYQNDQGATTNPKRVFVDWTRHVNGVEVTKPESKSYQVEPSGSLTLFSGTRSTSIGASTEFDVSLNTIEDALYRLTHSAGTAPAFRTARAYSPSGVLLTLTVNNNATLEVTQAAGDFLAQVGDTVFIPGASTGDSASPFGGLNEGRWVVISAAALRLVLVRPVGVTFEGVSETVTPSANTQLIIFSASGVQVGDTLEISAGFSSVTQQAFVVSAVTPTWVEFVSTDALPLEEGVVPTASGMVFYTSAKRFLRVEVDQEAVIRLNGDSSNTNRISPRVAGDSDQMGHFEKWGPCWSAVVVNRSSTAALIVNTISAE